MKKHLKLLVVMLFAVIVCNSVPAYAASTVNLKDFKASSSKWYDYKSSIRTPQNKVYNDVYCFDASLDNCFASFKTNGKYKKFTFRVVTSSLTGDGNFTLKFYGDGNRIKTISNVTNNNQDKGTYTIDLSGVNKLTIKATNTGSWGNGFVYIANGKFYKSSSNSTKENPKLNTNSKTLNVNQYATLKVTGTKKTAKWSTSNAKVAVISKDKTNQYKVKAVAPGTAYIKAKVSGKTLSCKVTVKNADAKATSLYLRSVSGGDFVKGVTNAKAAFVLGNASTNVTVKIVDSTNEVKYIKKFKSCAAKRLYSFTWNGKQGGAYVPTGIYRICVTAGRKNTYSGYIRFVNNDFAGGDGSKTNPYKVSNVKQLQKVNSHNGRYFVQTADIDFEYNSVTPLFSIDVPFVGVYDGKNYAIDNIMCSTDDDNVALFCSVGNKGVINSVILRNCTFVGNEVVGALVANNKGKITNCYMERCSVTAKKLYAGAISSQNYGVIKGCKTTQNIVHAQGGTWWRSNYNGVNSYDSFAGIYSAWNEGTIASNQSSYDNVRTNNNCAGSMAGYNKGTITSNTITNDSLSGDSMVGGVAGYNIGTVSYNDVSDEENKIVVSYCGIGGICGYNSGANVNNNYTGKLNQCGQNHWNS